MVSPASRKALCSLASTRLCLLLSADLLPAVLCLLLATPSGGLLVTDEARANQAILGLELLQLVLVVIDEPEACAPAAAKRRLEAEELDTIVVMHLVHLRKFTSQVLLRHVRHARVQNVKHELLPTQQWVALELPRANAEIAHGAQRIRCARRACEECALQ